MLALGPERINHFAHQVEIHYNTNGTQWPARGPDIWRHFKTVEVAFSIDDLGARFEYQRTNADWAVVLDTITSFQYLRDHMPNLRLQCCSTVNIFNVRYIDQLANWIAMQSFDFVYWNIMHDAWYFSIAALSATAKQAIAKHLNSAQTGYRKDFGGIVDFMMQGQSTDGVETCQQILKLDRRRDQNLAIVAPELAKLLNYVKA